ncbi:unspecific monooxygenase [Sarracenia purpurea var. burkii]
MSNMVQMLVPIFSAFIFVFIFSIPYLIKRRRLCFNTKIGEKNLPPSPPHLLIIGHLHQLGSRPHRSLLSLARRHGPIMLLRLGNKQAVVVSSADAAREIMKTHDLVFSDRPEFKVTRKLLYNLKDVSMEPYGESLSASKSTASCSSPKVFTQAVPPQEAVLTLKAMILIASPMHVISLISPLSGVAFSVFFSLSIWVGNDDGHVFPSDRLYTPDPPGASLAGPAGELNFLVNEEKVMKVGLIEQIKWRFLSWSRTRQPEKLKRTEMERTRTVRSSFCEILKR